jgi:hypothetical protein
VTGCPVGDADRCGDQTPCAECPAAFCQWAGCHLPSHRYEDGWHHCRAHLAEHRWLNNSNTDAEERAELIRRLNAEGWSDVAIAQRVGVHGSIISRQRRRMGIPAVTPGGPEPTQPHGTLAAARRHQRRKEPLCEPCRQAETRRRRTAGYAKRQGKWAV